MSDHDDPQQRPETTPKTGSAMLADLIVTMEVERRERERDRSEQALEREEQAKFRTWMASQIKAIKSDIGSLAHDAQLRNARLTEIEQKVSRLPCQPGGGNGMACAEEGGLEP